MVRKAARKIAEGSAKRVTVTKDNIAQLLGTRKYTADEILKTDEVGIVNGLAWTAVGGDTLDVEVNVMDGSGKLELTGNLGDVMKESAHAALSYIRANAEKYHVDPERIGIWGTSSGGNTALLLGLTDGDPTFEEGDYADESSGVKAVVDCFGPTDLVKMIDDQYAANPRNEENLLWALAGRNEETYKDVLGKISPINYVIPGKKLPPFLILHGDADDVVLFEDSEALYNKLIRTGHEADFVHVTGAPHEGDFWSEELLEIIFDFIEKNV